MTTGIRSTNPSSPLPTAHRPLSNANLSPSNANQNRTRGVLTRLAAPTANHCPAVPCGESTTANRHLKNLLPGDQLATCLTLGSDCGTIPATSITNCSWIYGNMSTASFVARRNGLVLVLVLSLGMVVASRPPCARGAETATRPNIVFILADDLGYG